MFNTGIIAQNDYITPNLIRWYPFDAGTVLDSSNTKVDLVSYKWQPSITTGTTIPTGVLVSGATYFTGGTGTANSVTNPFGSLTTNDGVNGIVYGGAHSVCLWIKLTDSNYLTTSPITLGFENPSLPTDIGTRNVIVIRIEPTSTASYSKNIYIQRYNSTASDTLYAPYTIVNGWIFVAYTQSTTVLKSYIDGNYISQDASLNAASTLTGSYRKGLHVGALLAKPTASAGYTEWPHKGYIDDVRLYNKELTAAEITEIYNYTKGRYNEMVDKTYIISSDATISIPSGYTSMEYLVVGAGGGGGGAATNSSAGGGGGGGEVVTGTTSSPAGGTYTFTIGAGGTAGSTSGGAGGAGGDTIITKPDSSTITAKGGAGGAGSAAAAGNRIGFDSGSGGGSSVAAYTGGGAGNSGHLGGAGTSTTAGAGGGGANGNGSTSTVSTTAGNGGGAAKSVSISGNATDYGKGGNSYTISGSANTTGTAGTANSGNGGNGGFRASASRAGGAGGKGVVIIKLIA